MKVSENSGDSPKKGFPCKTIARQSTDVTILATLRDRLTLGRNLVTLVTSDVSQMFQVTPSRPS